MNVGIFGKMFAQDKNVNVIKSLKFRKFHCNRYLFTIKENLIIFQVTLNISCMFINLCLGQFFSFIWNAGFFHSITIPFPSIQFISLQQHFLCTLLYVEILFWYGHLAYSARNLRGELVPVPIYLPALSRRPGS